MRAGQNREACWLALVACAFALACTGCAGKAALVKSDDATFAESQARLLRTTQEVERAKVSPAERVAFLQAESTYRYRFEPLPHSWTRYVAGGVMALTDFTPLQSLANAADVVDVRNHGADAATQMWEAFLARYPNSTLQPLALYRLGWSYRSASATGFPRTSPKAFDQVSDAAPGSRLAALAMEAKDTSWKSRSAVLPRSLIPGLAHFYLEDYGSGAIRLGVAVLAVAAITASTYNATSGADNGWRFGSITAGLIGFTVLSFDYSDSYEDAMVKLVRYNEKTEREFEQQHPDAP